MADGGDSNEDRRRLREAWNATREASRKRRNAEWNERYARHQRGEYTPDDDAPSPKRARINPVIPPSPPSRPTSHGRPIHTDEEWAANVQLSEREQDERMRRNSNLAWQRRNNAEKNEDYQDRKRFRPWPKYKDMTPLELAQYRSDGDPDNKFLAFKLLERMKYSKEEYYTWFYRHTPQYKKFGQEFEAADQNQFRDFDDDYIPPDQLEALMDAPFVFQYQDQGAFAGAAAGIPGQAAIEPPIAGRDEFDEELPTPPPSQLAATQPLPDSEEEEEELLGQSAGVAAANTDYEAAPPLHNVFQSNAWTFDVVTHNAVADEDYGGNYNAAGELIDDSHNFIIDEANPEDSRPMTSQEIRQAKIEALKNHIRDNGGWIDESFFFGLYPEFTRFYDQYPSWRFGPDSTRPLNLGYNKITGRFPDE